MCIENFMTRLFSIGLYFSFYLICRYAATGSCNIFVFIVTWVLLDTSEASTSSDKLGSADASAFMVSGLCSLLCPDTKHKALWIDLVTWYFSLRSLGSSHTQDCVTSPKSVCEGSYYELLCKEMMMLSYRKLNLPNKAVRIAKLMFWTTIALEGCYFFAAIELEYMAEPWPCDGPTRNKALSQAWLSTTSRGRSKSPQKSPGATMLLALKNSIHISVLMKSDSRRVQGLLTRRRGLLISGRSPTFVNGCSSCQSLQYATAIPNYLAISSRVGFKSLLYSEPLTVLKTR